MLCLPLLFGLAAPAAAQTTPTISPSTLIEEGTSGRLGISVTISNIPSSWVAPVTHSLTTTGTGTGHATIASQVCRDADTFNTSLDTYDVCDDEGTGYNSGSNFYTLALSPHFSPDRIWEGFEGQQP